MNNQDQLRAARRQVEQILESACPGHNMAEASLAVTWENLFSQLCELKHLDLAELNVISAVIHKLVGAFTQLKSLELKVHDADIKRAEFELKRAQLEQALEATTRPGGLTPEVLQEIEQKLNLL
ncbi:hypothetical protein [Cerasicoccus maritimus]|uniref:hypothetical protein n=1 Tax=Cerasicoccus maritimus TaxID=490089 RepID=UPI002852AECD|nr:hypothetical protein [Cerasicoccus maritimus]